MLNIKQEIEIALVRNGLSMRKLITRMNDKGYTMPKSSSMSFQLKNKRIRFETAQEILDYLGYELVIREKQK